MQAVRKLYKLLKPQRVLKYLNFTLYLRKNSKRFKIPVIYNIGLANMVNHDDSFSRILNLLKLPKDSGFIDVGANVGQTLMTFRSHFDNPYYGFEPNPDCLFYLNTLIRVNEIKNTNILPVGLSTKSELLKFYSKGSGDTGSSMVTELRPGYYTASDISYIPVLSYDSLKLDNSPKISLVKIDVEGAELEVITGMSGAIKNDRPLIICEVLDCLNAAESLAILQQRANKLTSLVQSFDYRIFRIKYNNGVHFELINDIKLKQWTPESPQMNDYLFLPSELDENTLLG